MDIMTELEELRERYSKLEFRFSVLERQYKIVVDAVAEAKTAILIATNAQTLASEAMIQASTGKSLDDLAGKGPVSQEAVDGFSLQNPSSDFDENVVSMSKRQKFYQGLGK